MNSKNAKHFIPATLIGVACASTSGLAFAQEQTQPYLQQRVEAPRKALELTLGTAYTQGFGSLSDGVGMPSVLNEGIALDLGLGYRIDPHWMVGVMGEYQEFDSARASGARGAAAGVQAAYHIAPTNRVDPWVSLGAGYRWLWETHQAPGSTLLTQGLELGRAMFGLDLRTSREFAIAPVVGADLDLFLSQGDGAISNPAPSIFVHAGLMGRFDFGGEREITATATTMQPLTPDLGVTERQPPSRVVYVSPNVSVTDDILKACQLKLDEAPGFAFDDSSLSDADRSALDSIAACFTTGPLKNRDMRLVGRADPRGTPEYNVDLGSRRAASVAGYLGQKGVDTARMQQSSRGARDASGTDEAGWASDRRVDIDIAR